MSQQQPILTEFYPQDGSKIQKQSYVNVKLRNGRQTYDGMLLVSAEVGRQLEVGGAHHCFTHCEMRQQLVVLHYVARHLAELSQIAGPIVHED